MHKNWHPYGDPVAVNWEGHGYFGYPSSGQEMAAGEGLLPQAGDFERWVAALEQAKGGNFSGIPGLLEICTGDTHPVNRDLCAELIGDAGPDSMIDFISLRLAEGGDDFEITLALAGILAQRSKLADIPIILDAFERMADIEDAEIMPVWISDCLEGEGVLSDHGNFDSLEAYRMAVERRYAQLAGASGSDQVIVVHGELFGVARLAEQVLRRLRQPFFPSYLRRRLEAATGIDCSSFYEDGTFMPLQAAALIEEFLDSPQARHFEDGVRYFFGHRIPDR